MIRAILAVDENNGLGKNGRMAWHFPEDFKYFKEYTTGSVCLMGRTTYEDIASHKKNPSGELLPNRPAIVLTRDNIPHHQKECLYENVTFSEGGIGFINLLHLVGKNDQYEVSVVGGKQVYDMCFEHGLISEVSITRVSGNYDCDVVAPIDKWLENFELSETEELSKNCNVEIYKRRSDESQ